ncbi:TVG1082508 [Thermoplasma volcanium GSS1]|uniref:TVG1082508 protein n=1 Tax=Thermoplasma volcanium (strain ATCC 51530 / DSM 4299 / JCM 9571 / NBRC 15438 / GSS1) TaxID=273116 RepID=Q979V3_THEVO|nr:hypothetical protein [Thermoplasma volcanium]BAB60199.1 TVG1082508 [Thermoplasma volcanium GSS1]
MEVNGHINYEFIVNEERPIFLHKSTSDDFVNMLGRVLPRRVLLDEFLFQDRSIPPELAYAIEDHKEIIRIVERGKGISIELLGNPYIFSALFQIYFSGKDVQTFPYGKLWEDAVKEAADVFDRVIVVDDISEDPKESIRTAFSKGYHFITPELPNSNSFYNSVIVSRSVRKTHNRYSIKANGNFDPLVLDGFISAFGDPEEIRIVIDGDPSVEADNIDILSGMMNVSGIKIGRKPFPSPYLTKFYKSGKLKVSSGRIPGNTVLSLDVIE